MDLLKSWQDAAFQTEGYTGTPIYPAVLSIIVNSEKQVADSIMHATMSNTGDSFASFSRSLKELHLNGNQPLLKETRIKDEVKRTYLSSDFSLFTCFYFASGYTGR